MTGLVALQFTSSTGAKSQWMPTARISTGHGPRHPVGDSRVAGGGLSHLAGEDGEGVAQAGNHAALLVHGDQHRRQPGLALARSWSAR